MFSAGTRCGVGRVSPLAGGRCKPILPASGPGARPEGAKGRTFLGAAEGYEGCWPASPGTLFLAAPPFQGYCPGACPYVPCLCNIALLLIFISIVYLSITL